MRVPAIVLCAALLPGPAAAEALADGPLQGNADVARIGDEERRLWDEAAEFDRLIGKTGLVDEDPGLTAYLQRVLDRMFPEFAGTLRVRILKSSVLNAFCLPNGSIYVNRGLIARFENEAQLASVLAHEASHFTLRHSLRQQEFVKNAALLQWAAALLRVPYVWARDLLVRSSMFGYSRGLETEADNEGFERLKRQGYDQKEAGKVFEHLAADLKASEAKEPLFFFSSHPKLEERIENYTRLAGDNPPPGTKAAEEYLERAGTVRLENLEAELALHRPASVLVALDFGKRADGYPPQVHFYLGEAYRLRGKEGDVQLAEQSYRRCLELATDCSLALYGMGVLAIKRRLWADAREHFAAFVAAAPDEAAGDDRLEFARLYLADIERRQAPPDP